MISKGWTPTLKRINEVISSSYASVVEINGRLRTIDYPFNYCLLNYYSNGESKLGFHADDERSMVDGSPIVSVSLGAKRDFQIKPYSDLGKKKWTEMGKSGSMNISLSSGDLLFMGGNMQKNYKHAVPPRKRVKESRISLTFRNMH